MKPLIGLLAVLFVGAAAQARYETCYQQEYRCHTEYQQECNYVPVCHMVPGRQQCGQEQVCTDRPSQPSCRTVRECGTNAMGQPICKDRTVCDGHSVPNRECHIVQRCDAGRPQQECNNEYRCQNVPRQQCGYEQVAKQCYVPDPEPTPMPPVHPQPPPQPHPTPTPLPPAPVPGDDGGDTDSSYIPEEIGPATISGLKLKIFEDLSSQVVFTDEGLNRQYTSEYILTVRDEAGDVVIQDRVESNGRVSQKIDLSDSLSLSEDHTLKLKVFRRNIETGEEFTFAKTFFRPGPH